MRKVTQEAVYICDACGKEIDNSPYALELVTMEYNVLKGNGWNEWAEHREKHLHKKCVGAALNMNE